MSDSTITVEEKKIEVKIGSRSIVVSKLPLKKYNDLLSKLDKIPKQFEKIDATNEKDLFAVLPAVVTSSLSEFQDIVTIAIDLEKEYVETLGVYEICVLIKAAVDVNRYAEAYEILKNIFARPAAPQNHGSTEPSTN